MFHLFGIHVLSELCYFLYSHVFLLGCILIPKYLFSLVRGTSETLFFEISPYFIIFSLFGILKFTKRTLSLVSATSDVLSSLSAHGVLNYCICFNCSGYIHALSKISFSLIPLLSSRMHIDSEVSYFTCSGNKWNIIHRNKSLLCIFPF